MNPYSYTSGETHVNLHLKETTGSWLRYEVDFPSAHPTRYEENNTVRGEYFQPRQSENAPLAILIHGWGDYSLIPCKLLARSLASKGIACFVLYLVFHTSRMPEVVKSRLPVLIPEEWFEGYRVSVIDVRQVVDWAGDRAEINQEQIAVIGISLGGFISGITMGIDERIKAGVFAVTGGNSAKITCKNGNIKWRIKTEKGYRYFTQKDIDGYMLRKQIAETPIETLQMRNNVEATIFQLGYHYSNAKSRYRGEIKHQMWANIRCLWVNFVRILKYIKQLCQRTLFFAKYTLKSLFSELYFTIKLFLTAILPINLSGSENARFSMS